MYLLERGFQWSKDMTSYEAASEELARQQRMLGQAEMHAPEGVGESVSDEVLDNESIYHSNQIYLDVRTPNDEKRGVITIIFACILVFILKGLIGTLYISAKKIISGEKYFGGPLGGSDYFFIFLFSTVWLIFLVAFLKYSIRYVRLESLTARRIVVRFNRITRQVYLLRPADLGGLRIMDWDKTEVIIDKNMSELEGTGGYVVLAWDKGDGVDSGGTPTDNVEVTFIGKPARNASELLAFWEYIRRYMEDGPAAVPAPKRLINKFPWPWLSFKAAWGLDTQFLRHSGLWVFVVANLLMLPAILIHAAGHWLSLLLCYEPRFPRDIEEAGR
ncbi:DUF6708 domain-containing protein [Achromobacter sp.]|uniref:DUF6708 domain-containing protein n=1 Tax=Achromobacter sp. TaxID=134375 RepID=UPI0028A62FB6|nr:DUF6708 domain-containing protein [Achromobacter sp.]